MRQCYAKELTLHRSSSSRSWMNVLFAEERLGFIHCCPAAFSKDMHYYVAAQSGDASVVTRDTVTTTLHCFHSAITSGLFTPRRTAVSRQ
jgi:hypothetical protein